MKMAELKSQEVSDERFRHLNEIYSALMLEQESGHSCIIAGGSVLRSLLGKMTPSVDVDVIFTVKENLLQTIGTLVLNGWHPSDDHLNYESSAGEQIHSRCVLHSKLGKIDLVYQHNYQTMPWAEILRDFDLNLSQFAYTPGTVYWVNDDSGDRMEQLAQRQLEVRHHRKTTPERYKKYAQLLDLPEKETPGNETSGYMDLLF